MKDNIKTIQIDAKLHNKLKVYCNEHGLKLHKVVESLIIQKFKNELPQDIQPDSRES